MHSQHGVEQVRKAVTLSHGNQAKKCAITVKTPGTALLHYFEPGLVMTVKQFVGDFSGRCLVGEIKRF